MTDAEGNLNAADERAVRAAEKSAKARAYRAREDLRAVLRKPYGRRMLVQLAMQLGLHQDILELSPPEVVVQALTRRSVALHVREAVEVLEPGLWLEMEKEWNAEPDVRTAPSDEQEANALGAETA